MVPIWGRSVIAILAASAKASLIQNLFGARFFSNRFQRELLQHRQILISEIAPDTFRDKNHKGRVGFLIDDLRSDGPPARLQISAATAAALETQGRRGAGAQIMPFIAAGARLLIF
jgi:hypothetical protein